ncbi:RNA polymerase sigma factor [Bacillus sp. DTU_2020_1000418_1_SI_GHA_SEK_038]|uniref:RNA polymerase sigma factor n=1 Tax=Bacillus sp. DTU_2020_1000418_1_SI_GHA_SEK_038 TaxID=3077585 RepID=UPI0028E8B273|nr:RNA polymerase sigma factor [Bacillus sp. DTU_2020_1000418_1_SI_GHA_SEK_038]WNS76301.1 RNA polymerase sigma factor [Bacillus sp. DTU_2020_1000418_1_SI_GHA_SEK_038]
MNKKREELVMEWYEQYYEDVYRFILFMIQDKQSCEDFVHDTFVRAYTAFERFDNRSSIKTWLFSIAKHIAIDEIRKRQRWRIFNSISQGREVPSTFNVEQYVENKETVLNLMEAIFRLKSNYRLVIILRKIEGFSTIETAEILNWSEAKVRKTLSRALKSLKMTHEKEGGEHVEQSI